MSGCVCFVTANQQYDTGRVSLGLNSERFKIVLQAEFRFKKKKTEVGRLIAGLCAGCPSFSPHSYLLLIIMVPV